MKQKLYFEESFSTSNNFIAKLIKLIKDLLNSTYELKTSVYKMIGISVEDISYKVRNDQTSVLTNLEAIYFDINRIGSIISKYKKNETIKCNIVKQSSLPRTLSLKNVSFNPFFDYSKEIFIHSQIDSQNNWAQKPEKDLNQTIKYRDKNRKKSYKTQYLMRDEDNSDLKYNKQQENRFQQKVLRISDKIDEIKRYQTSINQIQFNKESMQKQNLLKIQDQETKLPKTSKNIIQNMRKSRRQLLQYVRLKQKNCIKYINNIAQNSSLILSKQKISFNSINNQNMESFSQIQRNMLKFQLTKQLQSL